jgi:hypothetical protein
LQEYLLLFSNNLLATDISRKAHYLQFSLSLCVLLCHPQLQQQFLLVFFSGIRNKIPDAVFVSAATGSIRTRSESGLMFKAMILFFNYISA